MGVELDALKTDSLITPEVHLQLRTIGSRRPPYLLKAVGDTSYRITNTSDLTRDITVYQVERKGSNARPPIVSSTVPFLRFGDPKTLEERPYVDENAVIRTYMIKATCSRDPKEDFSGDLIVTEPWNRGRTISLPVHGEVIPPLRAIPSRVQLSGGRRLSRGKDTFHVLIELSEGNSGLTAEIIGGATAPFSLAPIQAGETRDRHMLALRLNEGDFRDGEWIVRVTHAATSTSLDIPVAVRTEAKP